MFSEHAFAWLKARIPFDRGVMVSTRRSSLWMDPHFHAVPDPRALMESHARVRHLDIVAPKLLREPFVVHAQATNAANIGGPKFAPLRKHLHEFACDHMLGVSIPSVDDDAIGTVMLIRGDTIKRAYAKREVRLLEACAPHFVEAFAVNRDSQLSKSVGHDAEHRAVALAERDGRMMITTRAFAKLFWRDGDDITYLPEPAIRALRSGKSWLLPTGTHSLYAQPDDGTGWLLSLRPSHVVDRLSPRERQVAELFAKGVSYKAIAERLSVSPATARNHLQHIYAKLDVSSREALAAMLQRQT